MTVKDVKKSINEGKITKALNDRGIAYFPISIYGCDGFFIPASDDKFYPGIAVTTCNKDNYRIYPHEILYIAIEDRKSVLYLTNGKIETNFHLEHWKNLLDANCFAQPHYSYIVNLNYVAEVTKDSVKIKYGSQEHSVYTSSRKISAFKKAFLDFKG